MGLQLEVELFRWLQQTGIVKDGKKNTKGLIELTEESTNKLFNGLYISYISKNILKDRNQVHTIQKLDAIKQNSTPAIRLYNWNIIAESLKKFNYTLEYADKSSILNLEPVPLIKILKHLQSQGHKPTYQQLPVEAEKSLQVDLLTIANKQLLQTENILQFFVVSISKHFKLSPQHTLNLFLDNNKYLSHLIVKGVKNLYTPIYGLLRDIQDNIQFIFMTLFVNEDKESPQFFFTALKTCVISKDFGVAQMFLNILKIIRDMYGRGNQGPSYLSKWMKEQGLKTLIFGIKRHPELLEEIINITYDFAAQELFKMLPPVQKSVLWNTEEQKLAFFLNFLQIQNQQLINQFGQSNQCDQWNRFCVKILKKPKQAGESVKLMNIMETLWTRLEPSFKIQEVEMTQVYLNFLKGMSVSNNEILFTEATRTLFTLMQELGNCKNPSAPLIYKILVSSLSFESDPARQAFIADNFLQAYRKIQTLPGKPITEAILKSLERNVATQTLNLCDYLLEQDRLGEEEVSHLLEMLTKIIFQNTSYGAMTVDIMFRNINNCASEFKSQFLAANSKLCLSHFFSLAKTITRSVDDLVRDYQRYGHDINKKTNSTFQAQISKFIIISNLVAFIRKAIFIDDDLKFSLEPLIFNTYVRIKLELKDYKVAETLIPLMRTYYMLDEQMATVIQEYEEQMLKGDEDEPEEEPPSDLSRLKSVKTEEEEFKKVDYSSLKPSMTAVRDLEKLRKKKEELKRLEEEKAKENEMFQQKKELVRSIINAKRIIQFGGPKFNQNLDYKCIYAFDTMKQEHSRLGLPIIKMINLNSQEEINFKEDFDHLMKTYRRIWRFLFFKYSSFGIKKESRGKTEDKINIVEIWKLLKDYDLIILKKEESQAIVRQINQQLKRKSDLQNLTYLGFEEYILQMCHYSYGKNGYSHLPPSQQVMLMLKQIQKITGQKGGNIEMFENPEEVYFQETEVIHEFNNRLRENPEYILPEGYKKVTKNELVYNYEVKSVSASNSYFEVLEVLDEIFSEREELGFHLFEPVTERIQKCLAKPVLFRQINQKMKNYKNGYMMPKRAINSSQIRSRQKPSPVKPQFHNFNHFSLGIKLGIANTSVKDRVIADEVAYWVDDMLDAVTNGQLVVDNKSKKKIDNEALQHRRSIFVQKKKEKKQHEIRYQRRSESVRVQAQQFREKMKEQKKQQLRKQKELRKARKDKEEEDLKKRLKEFEIAKQILTQKREEGKTKQKQEVQKHKHQKQEYKKGVEQYFRKKKQQLEEKEVVLKKNKQQEKQSKQLEEVKKKQFTKKLYLDVVKKEQVVLEKIIDVRQSYQDVWNSKPIQYEFEDNRTQLKHLFDLLVKHEKSKISLTGLDEISFNTLNFFALKFRIFPFMIDKNVLLHAFNSVGKEEAKDKGARGISYRTFEEVLFKIVVKAKKVLNEMASKKNGSTTQLSRMKQAVQEQQNPSNPNISQFEPEGKTPNASRVNKTRERKFQKPNITDEYLFDPKDVTRETLKQMMHFLALPKNKQGVEERFREVLQAKNSKPSNRLIKEIKTSADL